jgi:hypothetical protein
MEANNDKQKCEWCEIRDTMGLRAAILFEQRQLRVGGVSLGALINGYYFDVVEKLEGLIAARDFDEVRVGTLCSDSLDIASKGK